jgi:hypothetical protein
VIYRVHVLMTGAESVELACASLALVHDDDDDDDENKVLVLPGASVQCSSEGRKKFFVKDGPVKKNKGTWQLMSSGAVWFPDGPVPFAWNSA